MQRTFHLVLKRHLYVNYSARMRQLTGLVKLGGFYFHTFECIWTNELLKVQSQTITITTIKSTRYQLNIGIVV